MEDPHKNLTIAHLTKIVFFFFSSFNGCPGLVDLRQHSCSPWGGKESDKLSDFTFTFHFYALEEMATHSSVLAWIIPRIAEPGGLPSMGSHRVGHD